MAQDNQAPYDPYIPSGGSAKPAGGEPGDARTQALQSVSDTLNPCDVLVDGYPRCER